MFENTEKEYIEKKIAEAVEMPRLARIEKVREHTSPDDTSNFEADVILRDDDVQYSNVPIATPIDGLISPPDEETRPLCILTFIDGDGNNPIITDILYTNQDRAPIGEEGMVRLKRGELYFEADKDGDYMRIAHRNEEGDEPTLELGIDNTGSEPELTFSPGQGDFSISVGGALSFLVGGAISLGDGGQPVARVGDSVSVDPETGEGEITSGSDTVSAP